MPIHDSCARTLQRSRGLRLLPWLCSLGSLALAVLSVPNALADGPGCTKKDLEAADNSAPERDIAARTKAVFGKIEECKGKLTQREEAGAIRDLLFYYSRRRFEKDIEGCRSVAAKGLRLDLDALPPEAEVIIEAYVRCGGDCTNVTTPKARRDCDWNHAKVVEAQEAAAKAELRALNGKTAAEVELEQPVTCDPRKARKTIALLDQRAFREQGVRFVQQYRLHCQQAMSTDQRVALANDEALLRFHWDDDAGCLRALSGIGGPVPDSTAWNRALCGGDCTLEPGECLAVADARRKALAGRPIREQRRQVTRKLCWDCEPGTPCEPPKMKNGKPKGEGVAFSWNLKTARNVRGGDVGPSYPLYWVGDLNGDGIGDFATVRKEKGDLVDYLIKYVGGTAAWEARMPNRKIPYKTFEVQIGCGADGAFDRMWTQKTDEDPYYQATEKGVPLGLDEYTIHIDAKPGIDLPSVCIHDSDGCEPKSCKNRPVKCLDLSRWEIAGPRPVP